jgi:hypothetical protein
VLHKGNSTVVGLYTNHCKGDKTMSKSVGLHINQWENDPQSGHLPHIKKLDSNWHVLLNPERGIIQAIKSQSPGSKILSRRYERDGDVHHDYLTGDPVAAGQKRARRCIADRHNSGDADIILNEPPCDAIWKIERLAQFDIAFMEALHAVGMKGGIGAFSTGNLQIPSIDGGAAIRAYEPAFRVASALGMYLVIHCYAAARPLMGGTTPNGWYHDPRYYGLRWRQEIFPWMRRHGIPIPRVIISEFGLDLGFAKSDGGYQGNTLGFRTPAPWGYGDSDGGRTQYAAELVPFATELTKDAEVEGLAIYCAGDNGTQTWHSFMVDPILQTLAATPFPTTGTPPMPMPTPFPDTMTAKFLRLAKAEFGSAFEDLRNTLPTHAYLRFNWMDSRLMKYGCIHHSATAKSTTWQAVAAAHIAADASRNKEPWAGIGYHLGIRQGKVALLANLDTQRAHVLNRNHEALGICIMGNYDVLEVSPADYDLLRRLVVVLDATYETDKVLTDHGTMLPGYTQCPGDSLRALISTLRSDPRYDRLTLEKWVYFLEVAARAALAEKDQTTHDAIVQVSLPPVEGLRDGKTYPQGSYKGYSKKVYTKWAYWLEEVARRARDREGLHKVHDAIMSVSLPPVLASRDSQKAA